MEWFDGRRRGRERVFLFTPSSRRREKLIKGWEFREAGSTDPVLTKTEGAKVDFLFRLAPQIQCAWRMRNREINHCALKEIVTPRGALRIGVARLQFFFWEVIFYFVGQRQIYRYGTSEQVFSQNLPYLQRKKFFQVCKGVRWNLAQVVVR